MDRSQEIISKLESIRNLPTLPTVVEQLRAAVRDPSSDATRIAGIIKDDPAMMARILKVVNSVLYSGSEPITSLQLAVARLGLNAISNIALSTAVFSTFEKADQKDFDREQFWRHSISTGIAVNVLADRCKASLTRRFGKDVLHLSGLLHDIGKIIFEQFFHDEFIQAVHLSSGKSMALVDAENEVIGTDHAQVGAWLGMRWNLSQDVLQVIRWHHSPDSADAESQELVMLCHNANHICNIEKIGDGGDTAAPACHHDAWTKLGLTVRDISDVVDKVAEESKRSEVLMAFVN